MKKKNKKSLCSLHKTYKAVYPPSANCDICREKWLNSENGQDWQSFFDELKVGTPWEGDFLERLEEETRDSKLKDLIRRMMKAYYSLLEIESEAYELCNKNLFMELNENIDE